MPNDDLEALIRRTVAASSPGSTRGDDEPPSWAKSLMHDVQTMKSRHDEQDRERQASDIARVIQSRMNRPVSDAGGAAAPPTFTDDTPLWQLTNEDRAQLIKRKGLGWYASTLRTQLKGTRVKLR